MSAPRVRPRGAHVFSLRRDQIFNCGVGGALLAFLPIAERVINPTRC